MTQNMKFVYNIFFVLFVLLSCDIYASSSRNSKNEAIKNPVQATIEPKAEEVYKKIISEYKTSLKNTPPSVRKEIRKFRIEIAKLQHQKRELYRRLSVGAQAYLSKEEEFRKKLPLDKDGTINIQEFNKVDPSQVNSN